MQSKEHNLPSSGNRFTPNEIPNLLLIMGPNTTLCDVTNDVIVADIYIYLFIKIPNLFHT